MYIMAFKKFAFIFCYIKKYNKKLGIRFSSIKQNYINFYQDRMILTIKTSLLLSIKIYIHMYMLN